MRCRKCQKEILDDSIFCSYCGIAQDEKPRDRKTKSRGNGTGSAYKLPNGKWRAAVTCGYIIENGTSRRIYKTKSGFKTKKEALAYIPTLQDTQENVKEVKFYKLYEEWSGQHFKDLSKSKISSYTTAYKHCKPLYYRNISGIRLKDLQNVVDLREGEYYPKHDLKVLFNLMFKYAVQNDYVIKNYAQFIKLPPLARSKKDAFTTDEINSLWNIYDNGNKFTGYILIMIYTGMRLGELQALRKENVYHEESYMIGGIKTEAGIDRQIVIAKKIKPIVSQFYESGKRKLLEMAEDRFYEQYYEVLEQARTRRLTPHCCRHTFATLMAEAGTQPAIIKDIAGHENYQTSRRKRDLNYLSVMQSCKTVYNYVLKSVEFESF